MGTREKKTAKIGPSKARTGDVKPAPSSARRLLTFLERRSLPVVLALLVIGSLRIVLTYNVFNHTFDEPAHIACGMEWLADGVYRWEAQHPPLARIASAIGPYLRGIRSQGTERGHAIPMLAEGTAVLYKGHHYDLTLATARLGILPFFWIACLVVYWWGRRYFGPAIGVLAVFFFSFVPPVLAHAGLATTDMALTAFLGLTFLRGAIWLEAPTWRNALWLGVSGGLTVLSKFSSLLFFPASAALALAWYWSVVRPKISWRAEIVKRLRSIPLAALVACLIIWAGYRFSFGPVDGISFRVPAPELFKGIQEVREHNVTGHPGYLLGEHRDTGWWYFFEVALAVKTPLAFLLLLGLGCLLALANEGLLRGAWLPLTFSFGILIVAAFGQINIGIRHVLPVYIGFSLLAAIALVWLLQRSSRGRIAAGLLAGWLAASSLFAHPDYLAYFNELAGSHPENILVDSDLDWGQDAKRLSKRLRELGAKEVAFSTLLIANFEREHGFPHMNIINAYKPVPGWNAAGMVMVKQRLGLFNEHPEVPVWAETVPPKEKVGKSILLWYFPYPNESGGAAAAQPGK